MRAIDEASGVVWAKAIAPLVTKSATATVSCSEREGMVSPCIGVRVVGVANARARAAAIALACRGRADALEALSSIVKGGFGGNAAQPAPGRPTTLRTTSRSERDRRISRAMAIHS